MANVVLEGVSKTFEAGVSAVRNLDLEIADREFMVLVGPSGCGKSTTLRMVAGLESPTAGKIRIGDRVVNQVPPKDRDIAMVFQNYALYPHMSVYKNMAFGLQLRYGGNWLTRRWRRWRDPETARQSELRRSEIKDRVRQAATMLGIDQLLDRMPGQLSGGERQRVALGRALVRDPEAFLFDEPLSNLDAKLRVGMRREIKQLHARLETTMIYVTHDQTEALTLGDRIAVLDEGQLQQVGRPLELYDQPANRFVGQFIGSPPMNLLSGQLRTSPPNPTFVSGALHWRWGLEGVPLEAVLARLGNHPTGNHPTGNHPTGNHPTGNHPTGEVDHRQVELGVRPEDVDVAAAATGGGESAAGWIECEQPAHVQAREQLGDSTLLEIGWPNQPGRLTCKAEGRCQLQPHDQVRVRLRRERIHFFDPSTGNNLSPSS